MFGYIFENSIEQFSGVTGQDFPQEKISLCFEWDNGLYLQKIKIEAHEAARNSFEAIVKSQTKFVVLII